MTATLHVLKRAQARREALGGAGAAAGPGHEHAAGCGCGARPPEPTEEELSGAVAEATQAVERAVGEINALTEELRYELD
mmetsp:Transcript_944/g.2235  ORF Transcript_944/g.2235 Transcript_944/m.2235 type:complete len:80 (-) Transcript_944:211-450(-)